MAKKDSIFNMVFVLTITCFLAGVCLSFTYTTTKKAVVAAEEKTKRQAVQEVFPSFHGTIMNETISLNGVEKTVYIAKTVDDNVYGLALESSALGYGGMLTILVGVDIQGTITGIKLLEHHETPGLGSKAGLPGFLKQFTGKYIREIGDVISVQADGGDIQAITSATITSRAVARAATEALHVFLAYQEKEASKYTDVQEIDYYGEEDILNDVEDI
jgi:Na+-translocating ferredoxin:NAD+ oxidoreductase subunit G